MRKSGLAAPRCSSAPAVQSQNLAPCSPASLQSKLVPALGFPYLVYDMFAPVSSTSFLAAALGWAEQSGSVFIAMPAANKWLFEITP